MIKRKRKESCRICGNEDTYVIWDENKDNVPVENEFFLCHKCGFFCRIYGNKEIVEGISFDPKIVPLGRQVTMIRKALKKDSKNFEGLVITDHFPYKPKKHHL